jgi:competence protein ComEC
VSIFRESGASHILALSGLHLGIIYGIISWLLSFLGNSPYANKARAFLIIASCGLYTAVTGAGASITRAFFFILIREVSRLCNRYTSTAQVLMSALFLQLLISPESAGDIGFQLSYSAMAGIAFIFPWLKNLWPEGKGGLMKWVWTSAAMSISCQITTGPIAFFYFGTFPQHFLLTNLIAIPLTGLIIPSSLVALALNYAGICPDFMIWFTEKLVCILTESMNIVASM